MQVFELDLGFDPLKGQTSLEHAVTKGTAHWRQVSALRESASFVLRSLNCLGAFEVLYWLVAVHQCGISCAAWHAPS